MTSCLHRGVLHFSYIDSILLFPVVFLQWAHCLIPPYSEAVLHCSVRTTGGRQMPSSGLLENTCLIVGRTLVDPSRWNVPVLVSNFSQDTVVVAPFSEVGMIAQVSAIQSITEPLHRPQVDADSLPAHLRDLLDQISRDLDTT